MGLDALTSADGDCQLDVSISVEMWGGFRPQATASGLLYLTTVSISVEMWGGFRLNITKASQLIEPLFQSQSRCGVGLDVEDRGAQWGLDGGFNLSRDVGWV